jgi:hypothetical protein
MLTMRQNLFVSPVRAMPDSLQTTVTFLSSLRIIGSRQRSPVRADDLAARTISELMRRVARCGPFTSTPCSLLLSMSTITSFEANPDSVTYVAGQLCYLSPRLLRSEPAKISYHPSRNRPLERRVHQALREQLQQW